MKKKEIGLTIATIFIFVIFIAAGDILKDDVENRQAEKQKAEQLQEKAKKAEEERIAEEAKKAEEERVAEEARRVEEARVAEEERLAEEARVEAEKRAEAERAEQERIQREQEQLAAQKREEERVAEQKRQEELAANNNFYVEDGKANHDTSTGYDSPDSDPNEPTITSSTGYVASGNNYMHKIPDCKFIGGKATSVVDANNWGGAVCNCWYY